MLIRYITPRDNNKVTIVMIKGLLILYTINMLFSSKNSIIKIETIFNTEFFKAITACKAHDRE
ncbi:hypothetical protein A1E_04630 [Rickettsia canadensis str. McKiel]|uniref:Uncharacterized protein n=1 Tax=Rickettsia canadensis (strain McKiel) TaxID=293613 RepID=A8EZR8_RICCK|nr:hypothetical protein A1E_04630 [Rickettsia canadensis str. McKiel]